MAAKPGQKRHERRALQQSAPQRVGHRDVPGSQGPDEPRHAQHGIIPQLERIAPIIIHPAQHDIDRLQPGERLQEHAVVPHREILAFHQRVTEIPGKPHLLAIGLVEGPRGEHHHPGILGPPGSQLAQRGLDLPEEPGQPLHLALPERFRQDSSAD